MQIETDFRTHKDCPWMFYSVGQHTITGALVLVFWDQEHECMEAMPIVQTGYPHGDMVGISHQLLRDMGWKGRFQFCGMTFLPVVRTDEGVLFWPTVEHQIEGYSFL